MKSRLLISTVLFLCFFATQSFSQESKYLGKEKDLSASDLIAKAEQTNFKADFVAEIYKDVKNTYYAIDNSRIDSRYVKIRIMYQTFSDNKIVNVGAAIKEGYSLFLVNNILTGEDNEIIEMFNSYYNIALKEEASMNEDEMIEWMNKNDKYRKNKTK
jgi:hypothetical protein